MEERNETYLADWLANRITDEQLKQLVTEEDFLAFQRIKNAFESFEPNQPDLEQSFTAIQQKIAAKQENKRVKVIPIWKYASVAACLAVLLGIYHFFIAENEITTGFGNAKVIMMVDRSKVSLNAQSKLIYTNKYQYERTLCLDGEAFFEVEKGSPFTVVTELGNIQVLGTKFNVIAIADFFEVKCYEGKVQVVQQGKATILTQGETIRFYDGVAENWVAETNAKPSWISGESSFKNVPMRYVIQQFKNQYNVSIDYPADIEEVKFTGTFTHKNINVALQAICLPLHLKFDKNSTGKITLSK